MEFKLWAKHYDNTEITYTFNEDLLGTILEHFQKFLAGTGFYFDVDDSIGLISTRDDIEPADYLLTPGFGELPKPEPTT